MSSHQSEERQKKGLFWAIAFRMLTVKKVARLPAQFGEDGRNGVSPGLYGPDGVPAAAGPEAPLGVTLRGRELLARSSRGVVLRDGLGLQHDGALRLMDKAQLAKPEAHGIPGKIKKKCFKFGK